MEKIGIFCSAAANIDKMYFESARQIGEWMGKTGKTLIYGGADLGLMECVARAVKENGGKVSGLEGLDSGEWVLVDCGTVVVHCMQPVVRDYYNLAELWGPHAMELAKAVKAMDKSIAGQREWVQEKREHIDKSLKKLDRDFQKLL